MKARIVPILETSILPQDKVAIQSEKHAAAIEIALKQWIVLVFFWLYSTAQMQKPIFGGTTLHHPLP